MSMIDADGTPGGRLVLTADEYAVFTTSEARHRIISQVPAAVELGQPAVTDDGLYLFDSPFLTGDDIDLILFLLDDPPLIDRLLEEEP